MQSLYFITRPNKHQEKAATHQLPGNVNCLHYLQTQLIFRNASYIT